MAGTKLERRLARRDELEQKTLRERFALGTSKAARRRRVTASRGKIHCGKPGDVIEMSRGRRYLVFQDGSYRRLAA